MFLLRHRKLIICWLLKAPSRTRLGQRRGHMTENFDTIGEVNGRVV
jgi:hypothetical protein